MILQSSIRKGLRSLSLVGLAAIAALSVAIAGTPGFPFIEDFLNDNLKDAATTAEWDTNAPGTLRLRSFTSLGVVDNTDLLRIPLGGQGEVPTTSRDILLGDLDGDGDLDAAVGNTGSGSSGEVNQIYINNNGQFNIAPTPLGTDSRRTRGLAIGDLDRDGDLDIVAGNFQQEAVYYLNDGSGNFSGGTVIAARAGNTWRVALVDVDGDADLDLIETMSTDRNFLYMNRFTEDGGEFSFASPIPITSESFATRSIALGDLDNDGDTDFIAGDQDTGNHIYRWFEGEFFARGVVHANTNRTFAVALADINGDGWLDLVEGNGGLATQIYLNQGIANPGFFSNPVSLSDSDPDHVTVALITRDIDRDGDIDIVEGNNGVWDDDNDGGACLETPPPGFTPCVAQPVRVFLNNGDGSFASGISYDPPEIQKVYGMAAGDVDGDEKLDFVTAHSLINSGGPAAPASNAVYMNVGDVVANSDQQQLEGFAISTEVNRGDAASISTAKLTVDKLQAAALADLDFYVSNNGGLTFLPITPTIPVAFANGNLNQLLWKVEMLTASPNAAQLPAINQIEIAANGRPTFTNIGPLNEIEGQPVSATATLADYFDDPDGHALTFQVVSGLPVGTGLSVDAKTGSLLGVLTNEDALASPIALIATAYDGASSRSGTITINVAASVNDAPIAADDGPYAVDEGGSIASTFNVLDNDTDAENEPLNAVLVAAPANAALFELKPDGTFDYTHDGSETTADSFTYRAADAVNQSNIATVSITINPVNDAPVISLIGAATVEVKVGDSYTDAGASADDAEDGDISASIVTGGDVVDPNTVGTYVITFNVVDSGGLAATQVTRTVNVVSNAAPVITLLGSSPVNLTVGDSYTDAGATAADAEDGDISADIVVGGDTVNTATAGTYVITYNVSDSDGNAAAEVTRTVVVSEAPPPPPPPPPPSGGGGGGITGIWELIGLMFVGLAGLRRRRAGKILG
jgi:VCBS repeat-containing protein